MWRSGLAGLVVALAFAPGVVAPGRASVLEAAPLVALAAPPDSLSPAVGRVDSVHMAADSTLAPARPARRPRPVSVAPT